MSIASVSRQAARAQSAGFTKARKGMVGLFEISRSYQQLRGGRVAYKQYEFGRVLAANTGGRVLKFETKAGSKHAPNGNSYMISDREQGEKVWAACAGTEFTSLEAAQIAAREAIA